MIKLCVKDGLWPILVGCGVFRTMGVRSHRIEDRGKFRCFVQAVQHAVAGGRIGDVNQAPFPDRDAMTAMLADDAGVVTVGSVILGVNRAMENGPDEFVVSEVNRGGGGGVADLKCECLTQLKPAGQLIRYRKIELLGVGSCIGGRHAAAVIERHELSKGLLGVE